MKWKINHVAVLLSASTLAMIGLVIFQYKWIDHSRKLSDEIFSQRASMALCSTLEEYSGGSICNPAASNKICGSGASTADLESTEDTQSSIIHDEEFRSDLRKTLDFYNIDLNYRMTQSDGAPVSQSNNHPTGCVVNIPGQTDQQESFIKLDFPEKEKFMMGKLRYMIGSSVLILLFTAIVLLLANWWLLKQKKLLHTNVDMYNNMAHEFRTPLTNISLAANLLATETSAPQRDKFLDIISRENAKLIHQVERVLHLARLENGDYAFTPEHIFLKSLLRSVTDDLEIQIDQRKAEVILDDIADDIQIFGDKQHLVNVFRNLIENALKYATEQPKILISAKEQNEGILISIQDNGIGIPVSQRQFIFEKFQRVQQGNLHEQKGFGLGLAYVKRIVELHKGFIQVDSEMNKGSRFNVYLPKMC
ncbi:MAG TPA: HAMP domain-containing sensor histidine kinase [Saprospiraceae bacterium]|nr:HAMP domain-containing sensor histidine kinase [Saprospiraceae bacterium]